MKGLITQIDPGFICWFPPGKPFHSSLQGGFCHKYGSDPGEIVRWKNNLFFSLDFLLIITQDKYEMSSTHLFILPLLKTNSKTLLPQHRLDTSHSILPQTSTSTHPWIIIHLNNLDCHYWSHPDIILALPLLHFLLHICSNILFHGSWGAVKGDVIEVII